MSEYVYLIAPILGWVVAQTLKFVISLRKDGLQWGDAMQSGGMPSSHSAFMTALTTVIGINISVTSVAFGIAASLTAIIVYDAIGVRRTTGQQTDAIAELAKATNHKLKTTIVISRGHSVAEVTVGCIVGVLVGVLVAVVL